MKIIAVFKTHFDIGFTELASEVIKKYSTNMLEDVIETCEKTQHLGRDLEFKWTMSAWPLMQSLKNCSSDLLLRAEKLIERGQLLCHALPFTTHTELLSKRQAEHLFDSAKEFCSKYNRPFPLSAKMTDVPGHTMGLIKPLYENGVKFLHLGCNPASTYPDVPLMFWWEDKEGRRVLVFYNKTYGSTLLPPKDWKYPVWLAMQQTNDNIGPQGPEIIDELSNAVKESMPDAKFVTGTMDDFYNEIIKCDLSDLPVIKKDLGDTWIHGIATYPKEVAVLRRLRSSEDAEMSPQDAREYYQNALLFCEHTFGLDVKTHLTWQRSYPKEKFLSERSLPRYQKMEVSWQEQRDRALKCYEIVKKYLPKEEKITKSTENENYKLSVKDKKLVIYCKKGNVEIVPEYRYEVIGTQKITDFMRNYLTRFYEWAIADFGRQSYGEVEDAEWGTILEDYRIEDGEVTLIYNTDEISWREYGNCKKFSLKAFVADDGVHVKAFLDQKQASPYVEGGNLFFFTNIKEGKYLVNKLGCTLDCEKDIAKNANTILWCVDEFVQIGNIKIFPIDSPLVSFGESAVFKYNGGEFKKPNSNSFVFNLFNNMWGTNFPQWIEGDFCFEYVIRFEI